VIAAVVMAGAEEEEVRARGAMTAALLIRTRVEGS
jgi:hypothetical protein